MRRRGAARAGFTLLELIIALSLGALVLVALAMLSGQMARMQIEGTKRTTVAGWALVSIGKMNKELEDANVLVHPPRNTPTSDFLVVCTNWSRLLGGGLGQRINTSGGSPDSDAVVAFYCYDPAERVIRRFANRGSGVQCPATPVALPACTTAAGASYNEADVIATLVHRNAGAEVFERADDVGGIRARYVVGDPTPTQNNPIPQSVTFDFKIAMNRQYANTAE